jgi:hypothetical protein
MLRLLEAGNPSDRKQRLLDVACCRRVLLPSPAITLEAVEKKEWGLYCDALAVAEKLAEGQAGASELSQARDFARSREQSELSEARGFSPSREQSAYYLWGAVADALGVEIDTLSVAWKARVAALPEFTFNEDGRYDGTEDDPAFDAFLAAFLASEKAAQARLLRDIFGPLPFRRTDIDPSLLTKQDSLVRNLAQAAYENREMPSGTLDPARLAVLADALEETGCTNADILNHLRGPGPHVRGCWVVDMLLGKE